MPDVIVPLSISETFDAFWDDEAPFFEPELTKQMGNTIIDAGSWTNPSEPITSFGQPVVQVRTIDGTFKLPPNPFGTFGENTKVLQKIEGTDTTITMEEINYQRGFIYTDSFNFHVKWELKQVGPDSQKTIIRSTYWIEWINRPWAAGSIIEHIAIKNSEWAGEITVEWLQDKA